MKIKLIVFLSILFTGTLLSAQASFKYHLKHLARVEFYHQLKLAADSAFSEMETKMPSSNYDNDSYQWTVNFIDNLIQKSFSSYFVDHYSPKTKVISYGVDFNRDEDLITFILVIYKNGVEMGKTPFMYGEVSNSFIKPIKISNSKTQVKKILKKVVKSKI